MQICNEMTRRTLATHGIHLICRHILGGKLLFVEPLKAIPKVILLFLIIIMLETAP
jgi:hypothetical protein